MKTAVSLIAAVAFFAVCMTLTAPAPAHAQQYKATLTSIDAGPTNAATLEQSREYELRCAEAACFELGTATTAPAPVCTTDYILRESQTYLNQANVEVRTYATRFKSGGFTRCQAKALDAGNPNCKLYQFFEN